MAKKEIGKGLKSALQGAADSAKTAASTIKSAAKDHKISNPVKDVFKKKEKSEKEVPATVKAISIKSAIKIIYYLMAVDGEVFHNEEEKFDAIGSELDPEFASKKEQIILECREQLDKVIDIEDYYDVVQDGVEDVIISSMKSADAFIAPKLLVWELLSVAYSDENYDEAERRLLKYIVRKVGIDKAEFLEMESSILTLMDLEKELSWIKTTNRPYVQIESMVNEIQDRRSVIFESVKDLIML